MLGGVLMVKAVAPVLPGPGTGSAPPDQATLAVVPTTRENPANIQVASPARVVAPAIELDAPVVPLGLEDDGSLEVPEDYAATGWYVEGPEPGEIGPSVIVGHVDSLDGPAVFFRLHELEAGDTIEVKAVNGSSVTFLVDRVERHAKDRFPTDRVYGPTGEPGLRLITCGGTFDRVTGSYRENVVVFARLATPYPTTTGEPPARGTPAGAYPSM